MKSKSKLGFTIDYVEFCPSGENFVLTGAKSVEIWSVQKAGIIKTIVCEAKPTSVCWLNDDNLLIGLNDGKLYWCELDSDEVRIILELCFWNIFTVIQNNSLLSR